LPYRLVRVEMPTTWSGSMACVTPSVPAVSNAPMAVTVTAIAPVWVDAAPLIMTSVGNYRIDRPTAGGWTGKTLH
jgi:hypothetical protein